MNDQFSITHKKIYNLEERTIQFSKNVITLCKQLPETLITRSMIEQLIRSSTSISANYCEANEASSRKDFINKMSISTKETKESHHWLRLLSHAIPDATTVIEPIQKEARELNLIFASIIRRTKQNNPK